MKVLKYSTDVKAWKLKITCPECESQLEISAEDIAYDGQPGDYKDTGWESYTVDCGACDEEIDIDSASLPVLIQSFSQRKRKK